MPSRLIILLLIWVPSDVISRNPFLLGYEEAKAVEFSAGEKENARRLAKEMFYFGYDNYMAYAWPMDELDPIHCTGRGPDREHPENININDVLGDYSLTLIDSLSSLVVFDDPDEFQSAVKTVISTVSFERNSTVQVFEATIRVIGSLLSAHMFASSSATGPFSRFVIPGYQGELLSMAHDLIGRLMPAFEGTRTGLPYPRVNLIDGVLPGTINETCTAGAGSLLLEFGIISRLLGDDTYELMARRINERLWELRNPSTGLLGNVIDIQTGLWKGHLSGLGAGLDSFYEYLLKAFIMFDEQRDLHLFNEAYKIILENLRRGRISCRGEGEPPIYVNVDARDGSTLNTWIDALQASFAGVQVLAGDVEEAICHHAIYYAVWKKYGALPERFNWHLKAPDVSFYPLRPELAESTYHLYRATKNPFYLHVGREIMESINAKMKVECGFATVHDVFDGSLEDRMESFFLSETMKYLYLLFDETNLVNVHGERLLFSTEGHIYPIDDRFRKPADRMRREDTSTRKKPVKRITGEQARIIIETHTLVKKSDPVPGYSRPAGNVSCEFPSPISRHSPPLPLSLFAQLFQSVGISSSIEYCDWAMAQVELGWRRFNFFDKFVINDPEKPNEKFLGLKDVSVETYATLGEIVCLGEEKGGIFRVTRDFKEDYWRSYQHSLSHLTAVGSILLSVGEDGPSDGSQLKLWDTTRFEKGLPPVLRAIRVGHPQAGTSTSCTMVAAESHLRAVAVGFHDGTVAAYIGDVLKDRAVNGQWLKVRESTPQEGAITGLALTAISDSVFVLFALTSRIIISYVIENKVVVQKQRHNLMNGASKMCWAFDEGKKELIVASRDLVYFYSAQQCLEPDGAEGRCHALGRAHDTLQLVQAGGYIALVTKQPAIIPTPEAEWMSVVTVYDVTDKYIGFSCSLPSSCTLFRLDETIMLLSKDGSLSKLMPKHLNTRLELLYRKNFYDVAISLAEKSEEARERLPTIRAKYADHLYDKGDFANAAEQYKETIGHLEPSYVIKKFLDASKIQQLCTYLEALHAKRKNNTHHTTILINCYAKMGDQAKIKNFIEKLSPETCDLTNAINVLRNSRLYSPASYLAVKHGLHGAHLRMLIDDQAKYDKAIRHIAHLDPLLAAEYIEEHGRTLLKALPEETMNLIVSTVDAVKENFDPSCFLKLFVTDQENSTKFIQSIIDKSEDDLIAAVSPLIKADNVEQILQLAQMFNCAPLQLYILKNRLERSDELVQYHIKQGNIQDVLKRCRISKDRDLWLEALVFFAQLSQPIEDRVLKELFDSLAADDLIHPLLVLEILSKSETIKVSSVRDYVIRWLQDQERKISDDKRAIAECEKRMLEVQNETEQLQFKVQTIQSAKCCACATALQLPAVHFLCKHSFHVHCFESYVEQGDSCPACATKYATSEQRAEEMQKLLKKKAHHEFRAQLQSSSDGMRVVADYVGKGLFTVQPTVYHQAPGSVRANPSRSTDSPRNNNPFEDDDADEKSSNTPSSERVLSGASSLRAPRAYNPFDEPTPTTTGNNPFDDPASPKKLTKTNNPFDDE
ncbi:unnamed protein product, partial [Mesorhabditis spiculigera]